MNEERIVVTYTARDGQAIKLSPSIIKGFLVSGYPDQVTNQELYMYMGVCKSRGLNPFIKDCYLVKYTSKDAAAIIVSIDYYRKRARAQADCQGWKTGIVVENLSGNMELREGCIKLENEQLLGGWFEALPKDFVTPIKKIVPLARYIKKTRKGEITRFWQEDNQPEQIAKVAESQGLRATWPDEFQGLYTDAERESMEAQAGFDQSVTSAAEDEKRAADLEEKLGKGKAPESVKEGGADADRPPTRPPTPPPPPPDETPIGKDMKPPETMNGSAEAEIIRGGEMYQNFDPYSEPIGKRYHVAKMVKLSDTLTALDVPYGASWSGAKLHQLVIDSQPAGPPRLGPPPEDDPPLADDPDTLLGLQSDIAITRATESELYRHAFINQLQKETLRPDVKVSEFTIAECEALLEDISEQKKLRDTL